MHQFGFDCSLKIASYDVNIYDQISQVTIKLIYYNNSDKIHDFFYTLETPIMACVYDFNLHINDDIIPASLKEQNSAIDDYNNAVLSNKIAAFIEKVSSDIYLISCCNIDSGVEISLTIKYVMEIQTEIDSTNLRIVLPPLNTPKSDKQMENKECKLSIRGHIYSNKICKIESKTCKIKIFNVDITGFDFEINNIMCEVIINIKRNIQKSFALTTSRPFMGKTFEYCTMVNLISHTKILNPSKYFSIIYGLDGRRRELFELFCDLDVQIYYVENELYRTFVDVYSTIRQLNTECRIILFCDSIVENQNNILKLIKWNKHIKIFTFGTCTTEELMCNIARITNGRFELIDEQFKIKTMAQLKRMQQQNIEYDIKISTYMQSNYKIIPSFPTLYDNDLSTFYILSSSPIRSIQCIQSFADYDLNTNIPITEIHTNDFLLHYLSYQEQQYKFDDDFQTKNIIDYNLISNKTSFVSINNTSNNIIDEDLF